MLLIQHFTPYNLVPYSEELLLFKFKTHKRLRMTVFCLKIQSRTVCDFLSKRLLNGTKKQPRQQRLIGPTSILLGTLSNFGDAGKRVQPAVGPLSVRPLAIKITSRVTSFCKLLPKCLFQQVNEKLFVGIKIYC